MYLFVLNLDTFKQKDISWEKKKKKEKIAVCREKKIIKIRALASNIPSDSLLHITTRRPSKTLK